MFYYSHVDEQLFSCELLSIFQLKGSFVSLGDFSSNNPVWRHPRSSAASSALGWRGAGSGNAAARRWSRLAPQHGTGSRLGRESPGPYRALVPDGTDVAAALCHNRCVFAERPKDSPGCASGWHMGPFIFLKGSRGRAHCTCSELILPVPSLLVDSPCWSSRHAFHFFPSVWEN